MKLTLTFILLLFCSTLRAQYYDFFQQEYFFGNLPNAKMEAMGRADVAIGGSASSIFFNPAGLSGIKDKEVSFSNSKPFYLLRNSKYTFLSYAHRLNKKLITSFSINQFYLGSTTFTVDINNVDYKMDVGNSTNYTLSGAYEVIPGLNLGVNLNIFNWKLFENINSSKAFHLDAGALYKLKLADSVSTFQVGASLNNLSGTEITFSSPNGDQATAPFPVVGRAGLAFMTSRNLNVPNTKEGKVDLTFTLQFQKLMNNDFRQGFNVGAEAIFYKVFATRMGYFQHSLNDFGRSTNMSSLNDFTFGFGFIVPLSTLTKKIPFDLHLDYVSLKPPPYATGGRRMSNMRTYSLRLVWPIYQPVTKEAK